MGIEQLGPYRIFEPLGRGGMGTVYRALEINKGRPAAVKVLSPVVAHDEGFRERFEAEVRSLETLRHPHIVQLYGYGEQDGHLYYGMELMSGRSLQDELADGQRFTWREALPIIVDLCGALKHAHDHGVIHRDIKPANLLIVDDVRPATSESVEEHPYVKLADFGIAKLFGNTSLTVDGGVLGTADYMSPEQAEGEPVTPRSDIYSLGCVFYALLAGQPPFRGKSIPEVIHKVRFDAPKPIGRWVDDVPRELERILNQLLEKSPNKRVPTALALSNRLQSLQHGLTMKIDRSLAKKGEETSAAVATHHQIFSQDTIAAETTADSPPVVEEKETPVDTDHFVAVASAVASSHNDSQNESPWWRALTIISLLIPLVLMVWGGYHLIAPPTADELHAVVSDKARRVDELYAGAGVLKGPKPDLTVHRGDVASFLRRFPKDPRAPEMLEWRQQILAAQLEQKFERMIRMGWESAHVGPLEDLVLKAMSHESTDPQAALEQYQNLLDLFSSGNDLDNDVALIVRSVRDRMKKLKRQMQKTADLHVALIRNRLVHAQKITSSDPEKAKEILSAIIRIYGDTDWAKRPVKRARKMREEIP
jgi:serine/threonine protein kinase